MCLQALAAHDATTPFFLYFAIQAVHTPYDPVPGWKGDTYEGMLWDSDVYIGAIVDSLKGKQMYEKTLIVYSADNGGTGEGKNYPLRGEKHTNWQGGMRAAAFVSGGLIPAAMRGSRNPTNFHIVDWYCWHIPLKNGGDHSFGDRFRPLWNRTPAFWRISPDSWRRDG